MDTSRFEQVYHRLLYQQGIDQNSISNWFPDPAERDAFRQFSEDKIAAASARLAGLKMTRGELVVAIDSSNLLTMSFATTVVPVLNTPGFPLAAAPMISFTDLSPIAGA